MLMSSFRRSGRELAVTLVRRWPVLVLLACGAIVGATWHWGLRLNASRSAPRGLEGREPGPGVARLDRPPPGLGEAAERWAKGVSREGRP
jgi:hypothetical protein